MCGSLNCSRSSFSNITLIKAMVQDFESLNNEVEMLLHDTSTAESKLWFKNNLDYYLT
jgi:hypothetical protein